ncbi:hypothetical protein Nepgr_024064 [Nepenthes gracilis]|uniref:Uncharacterized protein n=1 Tax=Nepenthes gracilis TaxID=150966 RepID=A0AAD3T5G3_NEPGR|nr:hypothetical protein Nepgr_024064 [Nepenthes gracilis]
MENPRCTIEMEPKTLNKEQISLVRNDTIHQGVQQSHLQEVAVGIIQKVEPTTETSDTFIQEMRPAASVKEKQEAITNDQLIDPKTK